MSIFEVFMLIAFGAAWPVSIYKSLKSKTAKGKSLPFMIIINLGYVSGILHKIIYNPDLIITIYIINFLMVTFDIILFFCNRKLDRAAENTG